jgi:hypothetical protein
MPNIDAVTFDLTNCELMEQSETRRAWLSSSGVAHLLRLTPRPPWGSFDLTNPAAGSEYCRQDSAKLGGVVLSTEVTSAAGVELMQGLFKYRDPLRPDSPGRYFVGILWIPFRDCCYQLNIEARETGITGARDALAMLTFGVNDPRWALIKDSLHSPSDDEQFDTLLDHPLSKVRKRMRHVRATLQFDSSVQSLAPFRVRKWWHGWR